jgi:hypothetical protein
MRSPGRDVFAKPDASNVRHNRNIKSPGITGRQHLPQEAAVAIRKGSHVRSTKKWGATSAVVQWAKFLHDRHVRVSDAEGFGVTRRL